MKSFLLDERCAVERGKALGIAERPLGLDVHGTISLNNKPALGGVAQVDGDVDIGDRAKRHWQRERLRVSTGRGDCAFEVHQAVNICRFRVTGDEGSVGPAVDQRK